MLEGLVAWVLNNYLGKYVENLNTDQLNIALLSGEVELENLPLKREALRHIGLPIEVKAGFIGKIRLQVPVRQIRTASWVIAIEQLYLVAGPICLDKYDHEAEEQAILDYKLSRLEALEARWRADTEQNPSYYATSYSSWLNYGTSLVTHIIENLQLNVKDVHFRYEDTNVLPGSGIAFGVLIERLIAQSCDASWVPGSTSWNLTDASFKLMELDGLSVYWNHSKNGQFFGKLSLGNLAIVMSELKKKKQNYILSPVSAKAHMKRDRCEKPLRSADRPRIVLDLSLGQVPIALTDEQYAQMVKCIMSLEEIDRRRRQWRCRPTISVQESPKEWWKYMARCYIGLETLKPKMSWDDIIRRGNNNIAYVKASAKLLGSPTSILPHEAKTLKDKMEQDLEFEELLVLRELAMLKIRPPKPQRDSNNTTSQQARGVLVQWFPQWWGWYSKAPTSRTHSSSSPFDGELLDVLFNTIDDDTLLRRDTVFGQFNFALSEGAISLCTAENDNDTVKTVMKLQFEEVQLTYESRPRSGSHKFYVSLGALFLHDYFTQNSTFPILVQPQPVVGFPSRLRISSDQLVTQVPQSLFELTYENKPLHLSVDHSLQVNSRSLDVVYNPIAIFWLIDFVCDPHRYSSNRRLQAMKRRTRRKFMKNWEQILEGDFDYRSSWDLQLNISAPQILLVEKFSESNAAVIVVDLGRLHLSNGKESVRAILKPGSLGSDNEEERFVTPCSTPPGSQESGSLQDLQALSEAALHKKLYDHYSVDLSDLQVLVGKAKDNWNHAKIRGLSSLHVLERFNISLQIERRVITTIDPHFPSFTMSGNLPRLVVHVNEQKVEVIRSMYHSLLSLPTSSGQSKVNAVYTEPDSPKKGESVDRTFSRVIMLQFIIDQMTFELQSRGRSVAELQVSGVQTTLSKRPIHLSASLSVHGLLLVDALQEFGPDFELLVASHKHVGMDSISGSLRDSEPTSPVSPVSPGSPDLGLPKRLTSPIALTHALSNLTCDSKDPYPPKNTPSIGLDKLDSEALIVIELTLIDDPIETLRVANIQFNNLDIIANQETIVELIGFARRLFPARKLRSENTQKCESLSNLTSKFEVRSRTEVTFDFHRLNVLLLRAVMQENHLIGQKIATATMSDARIQATIASKYRISGSLGGLQVLDQTLIGKTHQRILSVGRDPFADCLDYPLQHPSNIFNEPQEAFSFSASRSFKQALDPDDIETTADINIRVGSVWYTHAPHLLSELRSCADEFKQYLSNIARQIGAAATDMARGLVQAEDWTIPQRKRLPSYPIKKTESSGSLSLKLDVILNSPVLVIPRSPQSLQVFVAHLGTMSLQHEPSQATLTRNKISLEVKDINLYSLDVPSKFNQVQGNLPARSEEMYNCEELGRAILHDTLLRVVIEKERVTIGFHSPGSLADSELPPNPIVQVNGVVTPLRVSLSRAQYEQMLDTAHRLFSISVPELGNQEPQPTTKVSHHPEIFDLSLRVLFELPALSVELKQDRLEQPLVELSMRDFFTKYEKLLKNKSTIQVSLRSFLMEDLLCPIGSNHRYMMQSSVPTRASLPVGVSKSCPDLASMQRRKIDYGRGSLPDRLKTDTLYGAVPAHWRRQPIARGDSSKTPPPSLSGLSSEENLVLISIIIIQPDIKVRDQQIQKKSTSIDFNCLDLIVSVESWMVVLDFLGIDSKTSDTMANFVQPESTEIDKPNNLNELPLHSETEVEIKSLTLVLTQSDREIAKANISHARMHILKTTEITKVSGSLGSMSLLDLTPHGRFYKERFLSSGRKALNFQYSSYTDSEKRPYDAHLWLQMSAVHYVHTQRFMAELQAFFSRFTQLQTIMVNLRAGGSATINLNKRSMRLHLDLHAGAPVIMIPVSSSSDKMILLNLGELTAHNSFSFSSTIKKCLLDVMFLELVNMDVYAATRSKTETNTMNVNSLSVRGLVIQKSGPSLLTEKCHLKLRVERNLDTHISRNIPDLSVHGTLSTMDCALDPAQYMLIRGLLSYNIGENLEDLRLLVQDLNKSVQYTISNGNVQGKVWTKSYMSFELLNVTLKLHPHHGIAPLACVNFIKSKLTLDFLSDGSQDIDLVSQEILVIDTRFQDEPVNRRSNVFTSILQPLRNSINSEDRVQAEVHHRRRTNSAATTVLLHSMRLTAILDWWETVKDFLMLNFAEPEPILDTVQVILAKDNEDNTDSRTIPSELKLNITDSELVIVENTSLWDTNAVISKCTAVLVYRSIPKDGEKLLSCNLSHCELFSCILGLEEETALSIIDPVGATFEITKEMYLDIQLQALSVRLSYHDVNMFTRMLCSLPKQTLWAKQRSNEPPANAKAHVIKLCALGFAEGDCETALDQCDGKIDDAALWLTQNAIPTADDEVKNFFFVQVIELETSCLRICIIDDCRDADVPLLELRFQDLTLKQSYHGPGVISGTFGIDYYNRGLSGWEPIIEQCKAMVRWEQILASDLNSKRIEIRIDSQDSINVNVTSTLIELVTLVKHNWTQDYYLSRSSSIDKSGSVQNYRRRSPFVPFALKNETGSKFWFKTIIATANDTRDVDHNFMEKRTLLFDDTWLEVAAGDTIPFTFEGRGKLRHHSTHIAIRHQVSVLLEGWKPVDPVTVDRVGVYFRYAHSEIKDSKIPRVTRLIFKIELEGSARKLVTVRSALQIINKLGYTVDIKLDETLENFNSYPVNTSMSARVFQVPAESYISIPVTHTCVSMSLRPIHPGKSFQYCMQTIDWTMVRKPSEAIEVAATCRTNTGDQFRMCIAIKRDNYPQDINQMIPGHRIIILAPVTLTNLLPHEIFYSSGTECGRMKPGGAADLHCSNAEEQLQIRIQLDGYPEAGYLLLPQYGNSFSDRIQLSDCAGRVLFLHAAVVVEKGSAVRINITAPYWIINKTGLPLVFKQEGVAAEFAGQFEEHEKARMVAPLIFSFSDEEASKTLSVRVGTGVHLNGIPQWSQHFHLQLGVQVHRLRVTLRDGRPDIVYLIGVATRSARGRYSATTVVTLSPRYQLHNRSSHTLELAQKSFITTISHPRAQATYITAMPDCHMPFHWPRLDKDQLLCVRVTGVPHCMWSGGIILQGNHSLTINMRDVSGKMYFLRVDVVLQESTYSIVFTDADTMPPPIRVDNFSEVPLFINQNSVPDNLQWTVRPHSSVSYALDEPTLPAELSVTAPGGVSASYNLNILGECRGLTYENFIYIAFTGTFEDEGDLGMKGNNLNPLHVETQRLVLEAGPRGCVSLRRKQYGARSQLWRMNCNGQLQHEGSSPPRDKLTKEPETVLVLDIARTAPQPFAYCALALRRPDPRRISTQTWKFTDDGKLCCAHKNMCVQAKDGFKGLREAGEAVLGPETYCISPAIEQLVGRQRLRPGSGFLSMRITTDGPTRVLQILDIKERKKTFALSEEQDWLGTAVPELQTQIFEDQNPNFRELHLNVSLQAGLGLSIISWKPAEELIFSRFAGIMLDIMMTPLKTNLNLSIDDVQVDNQLFEAQCTSVLYIPRTYRGASDSRPAIHIAAEQLPSKKQNAEIYKHFIVSVKPMCLHLEEKLILKLAAFSGAGRSELEVPVDENDFNAQRFISNVSAAHTKRYYFGALKLVPSQVKLSVLTSMKLPKHLQAIKRKLGLTLIKFEDATIDLEPFIRMHSFESSQFIMHSILKHYIDELKWQAAIILVSVDFLGNPLGLVNDFSEGVTSFITEGSVKTLIKNVTHGLSNSAAKVLESLSDGLGRAIMDEKHEETRQRIRDNTGGSSDHFLAGLKGLGFGILGGVTSIVKQTYDGATNEGFSGFFAGFGKGMVGTVTKPVVGMLDLASETATAIRETSRSAHRSIPKRDRLPRVASGPAGLLPPYNHQQAEGQEFLYNLNNRDYSELFVAYECLRSGADNLKVLVSNERVRIISGGTRGVVIEVRLADLLHCQPTHKLESNGVTLHYIELTSIDAVASSNLVKSEVLRRPKVRCDGEIVAKWVSQQINYAKGMYEERSLTLMSSDNMVDDIQIYT